MRNQEFTLAAATDIDGTKRIVILSGGTDGTNRPTDAAGAFAGNPAVSRARQMKLSAGKFLSDNDTYHFFKRLGDLLITGPTHTNVINLHIMIIR
ncbi:MAG: MOFRL family protein [Desulfobacterales bacterium]|nr:MOFRL family protein [Desulfobacterales bacterium]MDD4071817.1 MOFRL family protein [Desulfobacterales bacterium]MDD4393385.1 MOFRL family protein [Desulfobacterales bacterium]